MIINHQQGGTSQTACIYFDGTSWSGTDISGSLTLFGSFSAGTEFSELWPSDIYFRDQRGTSEGSPKMFVVHWMLWNHLARLPSLPSRLVSKVRLIAL